MIASAKIRHPDFDSWMAITRRAMASALAGLLMFISLLVASLSLYNDFHHHDCGYSGSEGPAYMELLPPLAQTPSASTTAMTFCDNIRDSITDEERSTRPAVQPDQPTDQPLPRD